MPDEQVVTGFEDLAPPTASVETPVSASIETVVPNVAVSPVDAPPVPHPQGPTVAEQLAARAPDQTAAEKAFAEPIKLDPAALLPHPSDSMVVGDEPGAVTESLVARQNRAIYEKIMAARNAPPAVQVPQPVARRITDQTAAEMREGARISAVHAERSRTIPRNRPSPQEIAAAGTSTPVFRPDAYVPDPLKKQGDVRAQPVT